MSAAVWLVTLRANELASFVRKRMPLRRSSAPSESRFIRNSDIVIPDATQESQSSTARQVSFWIPRRNSPIDAPFAVSARERSGAQCKFRSA